MVEAPPPPPPPFLPPNEKTREELDYQQVRIQIALFVTFLIYAMILILGRLRSRGGSIMKLFSTKSFIVTAYLVSFIPGLMTAPGLSSDLYVFWIAFMAYLAAVTNEISCYTLGDNEDRKKRLIIDYVVVWPLVLTFLYDSLAAPEIIVPIVIIFWIVVLKLRERSRALLYATNSSNGIARATKIISDFNEYEQVEANHASNPSNSPYKNFLIGVREAQKMSEKQSSKIGFKLIDFDASNPKVITLDKVLDTNDTFFKDTNAGKELQDTCTSFAMFSSLLAKMLAGYDNVDTQLFKDGSKLPPNSFALVEKELGFLYDYLFTNYYAIYQRGFWKKIRDLCVISLFFWLTIPLLVEYRSQDHNTIYVILWERVVDTGFTRFVILAILAIEFTQIGIFMTSKWAKVMYTCTYLRDQTRKSNNRLLRVIKLACLFPRPRLSCFCLATFTKRKVGQYSILNCFDEIPHPMWLKCWIGSYYDIPRMGQGGSSTEDVPSELQDSILKSIDFYRSQHNGQVTNGVCSLEANKVGGAIIGNYVMKWKRQARVILTWHIATSLLEEKEPKTKSSSSNDVFDDFQAAKLISNYIAYLVAFFPQMLPDHVYTTQCVFDEAVKELKAEMTENDEDDEDQEEGLNNRTSSSILKDARELKKQLEEQPNLWRTLADFWVETLLFLALSDHNEAIEAHANSLCIGGEFITHIWALLTHAGCSRKKAVNP